MKPLKTYNLKELSTEEQVQLCSRPKLDFEAVFDQVRPIILDVKERGDEAVRFYTEKYDGSSPTPVALDPADCDITMSDSDRKAIDLAINNVRNFHQLQTVPTLQVETTPGITCMMTQRAVERVGLYIPGGSAPLPSTAIMLGVPAAVAGCETIVMATPPDEDGNIPPSVAYVAQQIGADTIIRAGGAQAIAAMAWGTESVPKTDKIFGPGNQYVTAAKMLLQNSEAMVAIDMPAGPSEVLVIAGPDADPEFVAIDLLSQAEHGPDSQSVLLAVEGFDLERFRESIARLLDMLPRSAIASQALSNSFVIRAGSVEEALVFSNRYAPEHLIINCDNPSAYVDDITSAGSVFLGQWTPESLGDYASGTNHTLPTYGYARMYSGVSLKSFQKSITVQQASPEGLKNLGPTVETLARIEGLKAHELAVSLRLKSLEKNG